jgi:hypothetical protein
MQKWMKPGIFFILVIGMVFMSGCTSPVSTGTKPGAPPTLQIMNEPVPVTTSAPAPQGMASPSGDVPTSGVWVKVTYSGNFSGSVGTPGVLKAVEGSGDHIYQILTSDGPVVGTFVKKDASADELAVDVYKDGVLRNHDATTLPEGVVDFQVSVKTAIIPTATRTRPTLTPAPADTAADMDNFGSLSIRTSGGVGNEGIVYIAREGSDAGPLKTGPDMSDQNPGYLQVKILPNGESPTVSLVPGNYIAYLPSRNVYESPEQQVFTINPGSHTVVSFSAYSYRIS